MNDFTVNPITEYPAYFSQGNNVSGIPADCSTPGEMEVISPKIIVDGEEMVSTFTSFFTVAGKIYFTVLNVFPPAAEGEESEIIIKYCKQEAGEITYLTETKFPAMPESERKTGTTGDYNVDIGQYEGEPISIASCDYAEPMGIIDGFIELPGGLLINAPIGRLPSRPDGLLFWPKNSRTMESWKGVGRFW